MRDNEKEKGSGDYPTDNERVWFTAAIVAFFFAVTLYAFAASWTFSEVGQEAVFRSQAFAPFGVAVAAVVTFLTVVWRGVISTKQLNLQSAQLQHQGDQIKQLIRQNDAKEDETLIKLLQDGAQFIGETEKEPQVMAGIASLDALISNDVSRRYSSQALDIIAAYYAKSYEAETDAVLTARRALRRASKSGLQSTVTARFKADDVATFWPAVTGFKRQQYEGGTIHDVTWQTIAVEAGTFNKVRFARCEGIKWGDYRGCKFDRCSIASFDPDSIAINEFNDCDFSGCNFSERWAIEDIAEHDLQDGNNFFNEDNPPRSSTGVDWAEILHRRSKDEIDNDILF